MGKWRVRANAQVDQHSRTTRGQNITIAFIDDKGIEHPVNNCKSLSFSAPHRIEACELTLVLVGDLDIDVTADVTATLLKQDVSE